MIWFSSSAPVALVEQFLAQGTVVVTSVITSLLTVGAVTGTTAAFRSLRSRRRDAFRLKLGIGPIWHIRKLHKPTATEFSYRIVQPDLSEKRLKIGYDEIDPSVPGYGIWHLEVGDTLEIYWRERGRQYSTSVVIHAMDREYVLPRENTGH